MPYRARYFDGVTAVARNVVVEFGEQALELSGDTLAPTQWRYRQLTRHDDGATAEIWIGCKSSPAARLALSDSPAIIELHARAPRLFKSHGSLGGTFRLALLLGAVTAGLAGLFYVGLPQIAEQAAAYVPASVEARVGASYRLSTFRTWPACDARSDAQGQAALDALVARLGGDDLAQPVTIDVVKMPVENAFALPGGHIVLTRKLIEKAEQSDEIAGVIAHELGHVVERHPMIGTLESLGLNAVITLVSGGANNFATSSAATLASLSYSRKLEARADAHGIAMLERARISPLGFAKFFERLEAAESPDDEKSDSSGLKAFKLPTFLSTHPASPERAALARASALKNARSALGTQEWAAVKGMCLGYTPGRPGKNAQSQPND